MKTQKLDKAKIEIIRNHLKDTINTINLYHNTDEVTKNKEQSLIFYSVVALCISLDIVVSYTVKSFIPTLCIDTLYFEGITTHFRTDIGLKKL